MSGAEQEREHESVREEVRLAYGAVARAGGVNSCCGTQPVNLASARLGYSADELAAAPLGADLGLGCGNPQAIAGLRPGETVLDLGSGAGFDSFLAARAVGDTGRVIGVDMTPDMIARARANAEQGGYANVEFRQGVIEQLPVADASVDVIISNCVINLSPDKAGVFREAFRVLKPGGRLAISDVVASNDMPEAMRRDLHLYNCCIGGASPVGELESALAAAGFSTIRIAPKDDSREFIRDWAPGRGVENFVVSASIEAIKPETTTMTSSDTPPLHGSIVALVALAANIASNHPKQGLCQLDKLKGYGVPQAQIDAVIEISRHIRDEASQQLDSQFDDALAERQARLSPKPDPFANIVVKEAGGACCTPTASGQSCC